MSVKAITVSRGVSYVDAGVQNMLELLDYLGNEEIPVAGGQSAPLQGNNSFPESWMEGSKTFWGLDLADTPLQPSTLNASELIVKILSETNESINIVTLGPMTNVALALQIDPEIKNKITRIYQMGGAIYTSGNVGLESDIPNDVAEWNMYIDPYAANFTFSSDIPFTLIPLDATNKVPISNDFVGKFDSAKKTPEANLVSQLLTPGLYFWDHLVAVALTNPEVITTQNLSIQIIVYELNHEGQTKVLENGEHTIDVAVNANRELFEETYVKIINDGSYWISISNTTLESSKSDSSDSQISIIPIFMSLFILSVTYKTSQTYKRHY